LLSSLKTARKIAGSLKQWIDEPIVSQIILELKVPINIITLYVEKKQTRNSRSVAFGNRENHIRLNLFWGIQSRFQGF